MSDGTNTVIKPNDITPVMAEDFNGFWDTLGKGEYESVAVFFMAKCQEANEWVGVKSKYEHPTMVNEGWLEEVGDKEYKLTPKAIAVIYAKFPKNVG